MGLPTTDGTARNDALTSEARVRVAELLGVLDRDIQHVEATLLWLDALRALLVKRDDQALETLLAEIHRQGETHAATEQRREQLRRDLAADLGWPLCEVTLSGLLTRLTEPTRTRLAERQTRLKVLISQLKREHTLTSVLIADCANFNRSLLRAFFGPACKTGTTYSRAGASRHPTGMSLLNMQF